TLHLCRSESPVGNSGRYTVSVSDNAVINNQPGNPAPLRRVNFSFTQPEIEAIVHGLRRADGTIFTLAGDHYQVDAGNHSQLSLMPDRNELEQIIALIRANGSVAIPAGARRDEMIGRLQDFIRTEAAQGQVLDEQLRWPPWKIALYSILASVVPSIGIMIWMQRRNERMMENMRSEGVKFDISKVMRDRTEDFKKESKTVDTRGQERYVQEIRKGLNRGGYPHILISGPSGSGKTHGVETVARLLTNGILETKLPSGIRYIQVDAGKIVTEASAWENGVKTVFGRVLDEAGKQPTIVHLLESDRFANAGSSGGAKVNLLPELYSIMEQKTARDANLYIVLDSTRYQTIYEAAPDLARRTHFVEVIPQTPDVIRNAMDVGIDLRRKDERPAFRERFERVEFSSGALDAIAALGDYKDGAPPSCHLALLDSLAEEAETAKPTGKVTVEADHVFRLVARDTRRSLSAVRTEYQRRMAPGGFEGNRIIQDAILKAFYREYPEPRGGMINPLDLPAEAADTGASIFEAESLAEAIGLDRVASDAKKSSASFSESDFETLFKAKFRNIELTVDTEVIRRLSKVAYKRWEREGRPMDGVEGHHYPSEGVLEDVLEQAASLAKEGAMKEAFEKASREAEDRREREEKLADALPKDFKGK
ncbi:MAG TPA: AAA family ATPase, partial [bacterium]|nr:AAA family ATPase [bacterium]